MDVVVVGPYSNLRELGQGGMGDVYVAWDSRLRRQVALKCVRSDRAPGDLSKRLLREARILAKLSHPGIVQVHDIVEEGGDLWIVMEYVAGETAAAWLGRGALPPSEVVALGLQLVDALVAAHAAGVIHRDIKPSNVMLTPDGRARLLDFGLALSWWPAADSLATTGPTPTLSSVPNPRERVGTLAYMAPEVLRGEAADERSDVYSLGVTLLEMATRWRPLGMPASPGVESRGVSTPPFDLSALPRELAHVIAKAVASERDARFSSALELRNALAAAAAPGSRRHLARVVVGMATLGAVLATGSWVITTRPVALPEPAVVAVLPLAGVGDDPSVEPLAVGVADVLITTLARIPGTTVVSRAATLPFRERRQELPAIARSLGATWVVDGVVQRSREQVRVTLSLVHPASGVVKWSSSYDASFADVFQLQREVADALALALRVRLTGEDRARALTPPTKDPSSLAAYARGRALLERPSIAGNVGRAISAFREAVQKDPRFALAHAGLGQALWSQFHFSGDVGLAEEAETSITRAFELDANQPLIGYSLALVQRERGRLDEAIASLQQLLGRAPTSDDAHRLLGELLVGSGAADQGLVHLQQAVALRPAYGGNLHALGLAFYDLGRYGEAVETFGQASALDRDDPWSLQMQGAAFQALGRLEEAIRSYEQAVKLGPDAKALSNLGTLLHQRGRYAEAVEAYRRAIAIEPGAPATHRNLGDAYARLGRSGDARASYEEAVRRSNELLKVNPRDPRVLAALAVYEAKLGCSHDARRHAARATSLAPDSADAHYRSAVVHALCGEPDAALRWLAGALERGYSPSYARTDDDLDSLRRLNGYQALVRERAVGVAR